MKELFYDIETATLKAYIWRLGEQRVNHGQLTTDGNQYRIISLAYCWNDGKPAKHLDWGYNEQDSNKIVKEFNKIIKTADVIIGKNSDRFDNKFINTINMLNGNEGFPTWLKYTDDLEKQLRKHFYLPSFSLDYVSHILGLGGKVKMEFQDWIDIVERTKNGRAAFKKMLHYGDKDVEDTRAIWNYARAHFEPKLNQSYVNMPHGKLGCKTCGSSNIRPAGIRQELGSGVFYQMYNCKDHKGYAGKVPVNKDGKTRLK